MVDLQYKDALRLGQKEQRRYAAKGWSPCLPVLDDFVLPEHSAASIPLGIVQIPTEFIVGTKTRARTNSFAPNFMPILPEDSEFAKKWSSLCRAHLEEGIRDPIKVYEYMNRYYVEEGHKRVSVLKFFDAPTITGQVFRVLPERNGEKETELYYEFVSFFQYSKVNFIEFSKLGSYEALQQALGKAPSEEWTEEERRRFRAAYHFFCQAYRASGGDKLRSTAGDAMLAYIQVYGYQSLSSCSMTEIKKNVQSMWEEIRLQQEEPPIEMKLAPEAEKKAGLFSMLLSSSSPTVLKAAFLYDKTPEQSGWAYRHELGRKHVQRVFAESLETVAYPNVMEGDPLQAIEQAISDGNRLIFTTSPRLLQASLRAAIEHPEVVIMNCSLNTSHRYIRTYYARVYEAKFIIGAIAGSLSNTDKIGYICDYPIYGQIAGINAFALGAQMVNPRAEIHLEWSTLRDGGNALDRLKDRGVDLVSFQDTARYARGKQSSFGLSYLSGDEQELLAAPVLKWGVYYELMIRQERDKAAKAVYESSNKALNYYWGMSEGVVDLFLSNRLPEGSRRLAEYLKESTRREFCHPFFAPIYTQDGRQIGTQGERLSVEQIANMDYLTENIIGGIPSYEELNAIAQATVDASGILPPSRRTEQP